MREIRQSGSEGGGTVSPSSLPLSADRGWKPLLVRLRVYSIRGVQVPSRPALSGL